MTVAVVTGASGFVGTEVTKQLLEKGYEVRGTVRDPNNKEKTAHLRALGEALPGKLTLHAADLLEEGGFDDIAKGATFIFHTASPFLLTHEDPIKDLVDPAVKGTKNVLSAAAKNKDTVKRVILTSSFASIMKAKSGPSKEAYDEEDWNTDSEPKDDGAYPYSKVTAERAAWDAAKASGVELVVINPTFVVGPVVSARTDASSIKIVKSFIEGEDVDTFPYQVDVRDIAAAHILGAEVKAAAGNRYLVSNPRVISTEKVSQYLSSFFPEYSFPKGKTTDESAPEINSSKVKRELGLHARPQHEMWVDMVRTLISVGVAKPVKK